MLIHYALTRFASPRDDYILHGDSAAVNFPLVFGAIWIITGAENGEREYSPYLALLI